MKNSILIAICIGFFTSCNVTESIVFNSGMGGKYTSSFDMSPMMKYASENRPPSEEKVAEEQIDTTIIFDDFFKTHADSIATLSQEERTRFEKLRGVVMDIKMDEANGIFDFNVSKAFKTFNELETMNEELDEAMNVVKDIGDKDNQASGQIDELTKIEKVVYTFDKNTFTRAESSSIQKEDTEDEEKDEFTEQFEMQFEEIFSTSYYTLIYEFPRKVKSVSKENAVISEDGKTVTYKVAWNTIQKDDTIMNLNVILED